MKEIREELFNARRLYSNENFTEALEIFDRHFENHPELFHIGFRTTYAWALYKGLIVKSDDEEEILQAAEKVTELVDQQDLNSEDFCVYTFAVFAAVRHLKGQNDFYAIPYWLDKLNPVLLDENHSEYAGRPKQSNREFYYETYSKACLNCREYEKCIEISQKALESVTTFTNYGDTWHKWRIAKSLNELNRPYDALKYLKEVIKVKKEWYIYKLMAEILYRLNKSNEALDYLCPAVLSNKPSNIKVNLYYLAYQILTGMKSEHALLHAQLYYLLKLESGAKINHDIERLNFDETQLNKKQLERQIRDLWTRYKFKDQKLKHGTVINFRDDRNFGFIRTEDDMEIFFHKSQFKGDTVYIGQMVSFYTEESFDKSKNRKSINAINVRGE